MRPMRFILFSVLLAAMIAGCGTATQPATTQAAGSSMKGYELYSWQEGGQWKFAMLVGTNREKSVEEIKSADTVLVSVEALRSALGKIAAGQYVTWSARETLPFPPDEIVKQVEQICKDQRLNLNIAR
ncbi:MAG: hypothetical protein ACXWNQ_04165 [Anaerolineales bacterium]